VAEPTQPDSETREHLLDVLADLVARNGAGPLLAPPVVPGEEAFPDAWAPSRAGVAVLLRRLLWHAAIARDVELDDRRAEGAPPTERMPATRIELYELRGKRACFALGFVGRDDVAGTLAHEIGVAFAAEHRPEEHDPYRTAEPPVISIDPDRDLERGSIATVYLGLGVLGANAAYQQYSRPGKFNGAYEALDYDVLRAGHVPMSALAFLLAVQAVVRDVLVPPEGLEPPQKDEVTAWIAALRGRGSELRARLGIAGDARGAERETAIAFPDVTLEDDPAPRRTAFRWTTHRGGVGLIAGAVLGVGVAATVASHGMAPIAIFGGAAAGHVVGRRVPVPRCSACANIVPTGATVCPRCGAALRGDIAHLSDRLDAEERLDEENRPGE
jgi:hypothetical protein